MRRKLPHVADVWPILESAGKKPDEWPGWPEEKQFAFVLTHDIESEDGLAKCLQLMELEERFGFRSCFNFIPEVYSLPPALRHELVRRGFEVGIHGLRHDGKDFQSRKVFQHRAVRINHYLKDWGAVGFRAPFMIRNLEWIHDLNIEYDSSTFDTDPFEPQPHGVNTIFPYWINGLCSPLSSSCFRPSDFSPSSSRLLGFIELPYTLPQDSTLFIHMRAEVIDIWKRKLDWIAAKGGMALLNVHPDYINFNPTPSRKLAYPVHFYEQFLEYIKTRYKDRYWHALPRDVARFCIRNAGK